MGSFEPSYTHLLVSLSGETDSVSLFHSCCESLPPVETKYNGRAVEDRYLDVVTSVTQQSVADT